MLFVTVTWLAAIFSTVPLVAALENRCLPSQFRCSITGACIDGPRRCDSTYDCDDFSDELNCQQMKLCSENEFRCANGYCISNRYICDLDNDCGDNSDELACNAPPKLGCGPEFFQCPGTDSCVPQSVVCNGQPDCFDGADEWNCANRHSSNSAISTNQLGSGVQTRFGTSSSSFGRNNGKLAITDEKRGLAPCPLGQTMCRSGRHCIEESKRCDFYADCDDGSDEEYCGSTDPKRCAESENSFLCDNGFCIDRRFMCDSINDCGDMSDEKNCGSKNSTNIEPPTTVVTVEETTTKTTTTEATTTTESTTTTQPTTTSATKATKATTAYKFDLAALLAAAITGGNRRKNMSSSDAVNSWSSFQSLMKKSKGKVPVTTSTPRTTKAPTAKFAFNEIEYVDYRFTSSFPSSTPLPSSMAPMSSVSPSFIYSASEQLYTQLACENEVLALSCPDGYVIGLFSVLFGRDDTTSCIKPITQMFAVSSPIVSSLNCRANSASDVMKKMCEAKQSCQVKAAVGNFGDPCYATPKYLRVRFGCRPIVYASQSTVMADPIRPGVNARSALKNLTSSNPWQRLLAKLASNNFSDDVSLSGTNGEMSLRDLKAARWEIHPEQCPTEPVRKWMHADVSKWLDCHGLGQYKTLFSANDVFGLDLLSLDRTDLERVGVNRIGHQKRLLRAITRLRLLDASRNNSISAWNAISSPSEPLLRNAQSSHSLRSYQAEERTLDVDTLIEKRSVKVKSDN